MSLFSCMLFVCMFAASFFISTWAELLWKQTFCCFLGSVSLIVSELVAESVCRCFRAGSTGRCPAVRRTTSWTRLRPSSLSCAASRRPSAAARRRGRTSSRSTFPFFFQAFGPLSGRLRVWHWPLVADVAHLHPLVKAHFCWCKSTFTVGRNCSKVILDI